MRPWSVRKWSSGGMHMKQKICVVSMIASLATIAGFALCDQSGASQADQDLWNQHGCWQASSCGNTEPMTCEATIGVDADGMMPATRISSIPSTGMPLFWLLTDC